MIKKIYSSLFIFLFFSCAITYAHPKLNKTINKVNYSPHATVADNYEYVDLPLDDGGLTAVNDTAKTGPMQTVRVDVIKNDILTCNNYTIRIITDLDPASQGTAVVDGDYIIFNPGIDCRGVTVAIEYGLSCNNIEVTGILLVEVTQHNIPINVVPSEEKCADEMPGSVSFGIRQKFRTENGTPGDGYRIDGFTSPLVGDLNGDGKPEIVMLGVTGSSGGVARNDARYINIYNGQDGRRMYRYDMGTSYGQSSGVGYHRPPSALALADLDKDGMAEIVYTRPDGRILAFKPIFNGTTITGMTQMWISSVSYRAPITSTSQFNIPNPHIVDLNGDGIPEIVVYNKVYNGATGALLMAWQGAASSPVASSSTSTSGLQNNNSSSPTTQTNAANVTRVAMTGRRPGNATLSDNYVAVPAIWDIDGDGIQEIITGNRIYKVQINSLTNHALNTYTTIEGPQYVDLKENTNNVTTKRHYLSDGFTRVADIDGDGHLDIIVTSFCNDGALDVKVIVYVWDPRFPNQVKAALTYYSDGVHGNFGIPFVGDINGKNDGWDGSGYNKKLPEICIIAGAAYINRVTAGSANTSGRTGIKFHPVSDAKLRQGTAGSSGTAAGWDNNQTSNSNRRFNRTVGNFRDGGHIIGLTYDAQATDVEDRLKIGWAMEHADRSQCTGITLFDFDNDGAKDLCYRDETTLRVISPKRANGGAGSDYVLLSETASTAGTSVMFSTPVYGGTGFEYPTIADVNLDGSANILVTQSSNSQDVGASRGWINVYEYQGQKWAPSPPVWNQSLYNPLHINEDLTVPARPQSMLTEYFNGTETITPYNGAWIQQPIVKEGENYVPVVRKPDALITEMTVTVNSTTSATVTVTIRNDGTASINSNTPIAFYRNDIESANFISSALVGIDIFPNEKVTRTYNITGNYNEILIWARLTDNGINFPPVGYEDCDMSNNAMAAIDCPYLIYTVVSNPATVICGNNGSVMLKATPNEAPRETPTYQWYKDERIITGATEQVYIATQEGNYKCYVTEDLCRGFSSAIDITKDYDAVVATPELVIVPEDGKLCDNGQVILSVGNYSDYAAGSQYYWFKDSVIVDTTNVSFFILPNSNITSGDEAGDYFVYVASGSCGAKSLEKTVTRSNQITIVPEIVKDPADAVICGDNGSVLLEVSNTTALGNATYQWYKDNIAISGATSFWYFAEDQGDYSVYAVNENGCAAFSNVIQVTKNTSSIAKPTVSRDPVNGELCEGGSVLLTITNTQELSGATFSWYRDGSFIGNGTYFFGDTEGTYYVRAILNSCSSKSDDIIIESSSTTITTPVIESASGDINICTGGSILLRLSNTIAGATGYQWYKNGVAISGAVSTTYRATSEGFYTLKVNTASCYAFADELELTTSGETIQNPEIESISGNYIICEADGEVILRLITSYTGATYTWFKDGVELSNSNTTILRVDEAGNYAIMVEVGTCSAISEYKEVTKPGNGGSIEKPVLSVYPANGEYCDGGNVYMSISNLSDYTNPTFKWFKDGVELNVTTSYYTASVDGDYFVVVDDENCTSGSLPVEARQGTGFVAIPVIESLNGQYVICEEGGEVILRLVNSYTAVTYTWFRNGIEISNSNTTILRVTQAGSYTLMVNDGNCTAISQAREVTKPGTEGSIATPTLDVFPTDARYCAGGNVFMSVNNIGDYTNPVFSWFKDGVELNITTSYYSTTTDGNYFVVVEEGNCLAGSAAVNVTQGTGSITTPVIESVNGGYIICEEGGEVILRVATSYTAVTYTWFKDGVEQPNSNSIIFRATEAGSYRVMVTDVQCSAMSDAKQVTKPGNSGSIDKPLVTKIPADGRYCIGGSVFMSVQNLSAYTNPTFKWFRNGIELSATTSYYNAESDGSYFVAVMDGGCISGSDVIEVSQGTGTIVPPSLSMLPAGGSLCTGGNVYFTVSNATSYTNATYNWYKDGVMIISNTTDSHYIANATGNYFVQVVSEGCTALSETKNVVTGGTIAQPQITSYPAGNNICGDNGVVVLMLTNSASYSGAVYQWYRNNVAVSNGTDMLYSAIEAGTYYLHILTSDGCGVVSAPITVTKETGTIAAVDLDVFPYDGRIIENDPVEMRVLNTSDYSNPTYYWFSGNTIIASGTNVTRYDASTVGVYRVLIVDDNNCAVWSDEVNVTTSGPCNIADPIVNIIPGVNGGNYELCLPEGSVLFQLSNLSAYQNPAVQWYKNNNPIAGATSPTLEVINTPDLGAGPYRVSVSDEGCAKHSINYNVVLNPNSMDTKPLITSIPSANNVCGAEGTVVLRFTNSSSFSGTPQWYRNNYAIAGANDIIYEATEAGNYRVGVQEATCAAMSEEISVSVSSGTILKPLLTKTPNSNQICVNGSIRLTVSNSSNYSNPVYYWYRNSELVSQGAESIYYATTAGNYFVQVVDAQSCSAVSDRETLTMSGSSIDVPAITSYPSNNVICGDNGVVVLRLTTTYGSGTTYQWYKDNSPIAGANSITYSATAAGDYFLEVISSNCGAISATVTVQQTPGNSIDLPLVTKYPEEILGSNPVTLTFSNISAYTSPEYHWFKNNKTTLVESNTITHDVYTEETYNLLVVDGGCARWSNDIDIDEALCLIDEPLLTVVPSPQNQICGVNGSALLQVSNRSAYLNPVYEWYNGTTPVGTNQPTLEVSQAGNYRVRITDAGCYNYSEIVNITYNGQSTIVRPLVERIPSTGDICGAEGSVILSFTNSSSYSSPQYQWYKDNYAINGATGLIYEVTEPGNYRIVVIDGGCMAMSDQENISRTAGNIVRPVVSKLPNSDDICINGSIRLSVDNTSVYASNATYVWYRGDVQVQNGPVSTYVCTQAGTYFVQVIDGTCAATSERIVLNESTSSMINTPVIVSYPAEPSTGNRVICGDNGVVVLKLTTTYASGTTYQWYRNNVAIAGATGIIYEATEIGSYYIEVQTYDCSAVSESINVVKSSSSFIADPVVSLDPEQGIILEGLMAIMTLENATDYTSPYYYWFRGDYNRFDNTAAVVSEGDNVTTYSTTVVGDYKLLVVEGTCASISDLKRITSEECSIADPQVEEVHQITSVCGNNGSVLLQVSNRDDYNSPAYQWYKDNSPIAGQTRPTLEVVNGEDGLYQVAVTDGCRKVSTPAIAVTTVPTPTIKPLVERIPENGEICGSNGSVILKFTNSESFTGATYQWYRDNYAIPNATNLIYEVRQAGRYRVVVRDGNCLAMSVEENITVQSGGSIVRPLISKRPNQTSICTNGNILLSVSNTNSYQGVTYIWYKDNVEVGRGINYTASTNGSYFVQVVDGTCSSTSQRENLTMSSSSIAVPIVETYPASINNNICGDEGVVVLRLSNANQFSGAVYQWYRNDLPIANENDIIYYATQAGTYYLQITLGECGAVSTPINVTKNPGSSAIDLPLISMFPEDGEIPSGGSVTLTFTNSSSYSAGATFYWFRGRSEIVSENSLTYSAAISGRYKLLVVDGDCARWSAEVDITTGCTAIKPELSVVPSGSNTVCTPNGSVLLYVSNLSVYSDPTFQWFEGNTQITGATASVLEVTAAGDYRVRVSESGCKNYSDIETINSNSVPGLMEPLVTRMPTTGDICGANGSVILRFTNLSDFPGATYQWYKDNYPVANATELIYEVTQAGKYRVAVTDGTCMALSAEEDIRLIPNVDIERPLVSKLPDRTEICLNGSIRLSVTNTADYSSPVYVWYRGSEEIQRGALSSYVATGGGSYFVQVIDGSTCSSTSERINLTMGSTSITTPVITVYPDNNEICANNGVVVFRLSNSASYSGATYQWYRNGVAIPGETRTLLSTVDNGTYYIEVRTNDCYAVSNSIDAIINTSCTIEAPVITANPSDAKIVGGVPVLLSLQNGGAYSAFAKYYWFRNNETLVLEDASQTLSTDIVGRYKLLVVDGGRAAWSNEIEVTLSVCEAPVPMLSVLPQSLNICGVNGSVMMSVTNIEDYTYFASYQWYRNNTAILNARNPYYIATQEGDYELRVIDIVNSENCISYSSSYTLTRTEPATMEIPEISMTPSSGNLCLDGSVILYVNNRGAYENATYQWYRNGLLISGATGNTFEVRYEDQNDMQASYTVQVLEGGCAAMAAQNLVINKTGNTAITPEITASGTTVCGEFGSVLLMFTNEEDFGAGTKYYQWFYNNEIIAGATNSTYEADLGGDYRLQVVHGLCGAFSGVVTLTGSATNIPKPLVSSSPVNGMICGTVGSVLLYVTNESNYTNPTYQWYKNNMPIQGATASSYEVSERGYYRVQVSEGVCSALSVPGLINNSSTEIALPLIESTPHTTELCGVNGVVILTLTNPDDFENAEYIWYKDDIAVPGSNSVIYQVTEPGTYRIQVIEGQCGAFSDPVTFSRNSTFIAIPLIVKTPSNGYICGQYGSVLLTVSNNTDFSNATYIWYKGDEVVQNSSVNYYEATEAGDYFVQVIDGNCSSVSAPELIRNASSTISEPLVSSTSGGYNICGSNGIVILQLTNASDYTNAQYQWYKDNVAIAGANDIIYHATEVGSYRIQVVEVECAAFSQSANVTRDNSFIEIPLVTKVPANAMICAPAGSVLLTVSNASVYVNPSYIWYKGNEIVQNSSSHVYEATEAADYRVQVVENTCTSISAIINVQSSSSNINEPLVASTSNSYDLCGANGTVILRLTNPEDFTNATYQWYNNNVEIPGAVDILYTVSTEGSYRILVTEGECAALSQPRQITRNNNTITIPLLSLNPATGTIGDGNDVVITVSNHSTYGSPTYVWFRGNEIVQSGSSYTYTATTVGTYYVQVSDAGCSAISSEVDITRSQLPTPVISSVPSTNTICGVNGVVVLRLTNPQDYNNPIYQWYKDNVAIPGATSLVYHATVAGNYQLEVTTQSDAVFSANVTVTYTNGDIESPVLTAQPDNARLCGDGSNVMLTVSNTSDYSNATFIWYKGTEVVQNGTSTSYMVTTVGSYYVQVVDGGCSSVSDPVDIRESGNIIARAMIEAIPQSNNVCGNNGVVILRLTNADDYDNATYAWYKDDVIIPNSNSVVYHATSAGSYRIQVTEGECISFSLPIDVTRSTGSIERPVLTLSPPSGLISPDGSVILTVNNHGSYTDPTFIWYRDDLIIQNGASFIYEATLAGRYYVQVVEGGCSSVSDAEQLYLSGVHVPTPLIASLPSSNVICGTNGVVILRLTNPGDYTNPTFQWLKDNTIIAGANSVIYHATEAGDYRLQVADGGGAAYSRTITVTVDNSSDINIPLITKIPASGYLCGQYSSVLLRVTNTGDYNNATYVWYNETSIVQNGPSSSYEATAEGNYYVQVIEGNCSSVSDIENVRSSLTTINEPYIVSTPGSNNICGENGVVTLRMTNAADYPNATYQWYRYDEPVAGANSIILNCTVAGEYRIHVMQDHCAAFSAAITVTKDLSDIAEPVLAKTPTTGYICGENGTVLMYVANSSEYSNPTYIWYKGNTIVQTGTRPNYEVTVEGDDYYVQVIDGDCSSISQMEDAIFTSANIDEPEVVSTPSNNSLCGPNGAIILTLDNPDSYQNPTYQWFRDGIAIPNSNSVIYVAREAGDYRILVDDVTCASFSIAVTVTQNGGNFEAPVVSKSPVSGYICGVNGSVILSVTNSSSYNSPRYIWYKESEIVQDGILSTYEASEAGDYFVQVIDGGCSSVSVRHTIHNSTFEINPATIASIPASNNVCGANGVVILRLTNADSYDNPQYQWYRNNVAIFGANSVIYRATAAGSYMLQVVEGECGVTSNTIEVTRDDNFITRPEISSNPDHNVICSAGSTVILSVSNHSVYTNPVYVWYKGNEIVQNGSEHTYEATEAGEYFVQVVEGGCSSASESRTITNNTNPLPTVTIGGTTSIALGQSADITFNLTGVAPWIVTYNGTETIEIDETPYSMTVSPTRTTTYTLNSVVDANGCSNDATGSATVTVFDMPVVSIADYDEMVCEGSNASVTISLVGVAPWQVSYDDGSGTIQTVNNITSNTHVIVFTPQQTVTFRLVSVTDANTTNNDVNEEVTITVSSTRIIEQPLPQNMTCENQDVELAIVAEGPGLSYQWYFNDVAIPGETSNRLRRNFIPNVEGKYYVVVSSSCGNVTSEVVDIQGRSFGIERKWDDVLFVSNPSGSYVSYQWYVNGIEVSEDGNSQYYYTSKGLSGDYTVRAYYANGSYDESCAVTIVNNRNMKLSVYPNPAERNSQINILIEYYKDDQINASVEVYDALGKMIYKGLINDSLTQLPMKMNSGSYMLRIVTEDGQLHLHKVIVE